MEEIPFQKRNSQKEISNYQIVTTQETNIQIVNQSKKSEIKQIAVHAGLSELPKL